MSASGMAKPGSSSVVSVSSAVSVAPLNIDAVLQLQQRQRVLPQVAEPVMWDTRLGVHLPLSHQIPVPIRRQNFDHNVWRAFHHPVA